MSTVILPEGERVDSAVEHLAVAVHSMRAEKRRADEATAAMQLLLAALVGVGDEDVAVHAALHHLVDPYGRRVHEAARAAGLAAKAREDEARRRLVEVAP